MVSESQAQLATSHHGLQGSPAIATDQAPGGAPIAPSAQRHLNPPLEAAPAPAQANLQREGDKAWLAGEPWEGLVAGPSWVPEGSTCRATGAPSPSSLPHSHKLALPMGLGPELALGKGPVGQPLQPEPCISEQVQPGQHPVLSAQGVPLQSWPGEPIPPPQP